MGVYVCMYVCMQACDSHELSRHGMVDCRVEFKKTGFYSSAAVLSDLDLDLKRYLYRASSFRLF